MNFLRIKEKANPTANWALKASTLDHAEGGRLNGFFDTSAGFTYADKACTWARHLAEKAGVKFVLGHEVGKLDELIVEHQGGTKKVRGLKTADGKEHPADVVVIAGTLCQGHLTVAGCMCANVQAGGGRQASFRKSLASWKPPLVVSSPSNCPTTARTSGTDFHRRSSRCGRTA